MGKPYAWGDNQELHGTYANIWEGEFPHHNTAADGHVRTAAVASFEPNGYGLHDVAGNVWEWCGDWYRRDLYRQRAGGEVVANPRGPEESLDPTRPFQPQRV